MNLLDILNISKIKLFLITFLVVSFIFLFDLKSEYFQFRFLILILLIPATIKLLKDVREKNFKFLKFFFILFIVLFFHIGLNIYYEKNQLTNYSLFGSIFLISVFTISYYYFDFINRNIGLINNLFIIIFLTSCVISIFFYKPDAPYFCGGISNFFYSEAFLEKYGNRVGDVRLSFKEFIFLENSHLGMIAPSVIIYSIYKVASKEISVTKIFLLSTFIVICFIKSSTTLYVGTISSLILIILFNYKSLNQKTLISFLILIMLFFITIISNKECRQRFVPMDYNLINNILAPNDNQKIGEDNKINKDISNKIKTILNTDGNLSSGIYFQALIIAKESIVEKPFGWGLNRYDQAFNYYQKLNHQKIDSLISFNNKDGTNNLVKIIVEFGIFGVFFYFSIFLFLINNKVSLELKLFYLPFIITQSLRGAGYFNGGFALIVFLMFFTFIRVYKKNI